MRSRVVLKVGTSSIVDPERGLRLSQLAMIMETVAQLRRDGCDVVLVTSGAVGTGAHELGIKERPKTTSRKQALAAIGQVRLMRELTGMLATLSVPSSQVLLTYGNLSEEAPLINAQNTLNELFSLGVVPIINENDTVATEELRFGDNDRLSAIVSCMCEASALVLLTDVSGLYDSNPLTNQLAKRIPVVHDMSVIRSQVKTQGQTEFSTGGMDSKLQAAEIATRGGIPCVILAAKDVSHVPSLVVDLTTSNTCRGNDTGLGLGTLFTPSCSPVKGRKRWILSLPCRGTIVVDNGAAQALQMRRTLFAAGVVDVRGKFNHLEVVKVVGAGDEETELAMGLCNFSSDDLLRVKGKRTEEIKQALGGDAGSLAVMDRENIAWV